jgi:hypothetical protein
METVTNANQEKIEAKTETKLLDSGAKMKMVLDEESRIKGANFILTQELEVKSQALKNLADLLKAADEKVQ